MSEKMKVAVIGCGTIANSAHIPAYMANEKVDSRQIGFLLNGMDGYYGTLEKDGRWVAGKNSSIPLTYDAVVSATSDILTEEQVLTIVFVLDWAV